MAAALVWKVGCHSTMRQKGEEDYPALGPVEGGRGAAAGPKKAIL